MTRNRPVVALASLLYLGVGVWIGFKIASGSDPNSDLSILDPVFDAASVLAYIAGATLLYRMVKAGRTWSVLVVPIAFLPVLALVLFVFLMSLS